MHERVERVRRSDRPRVMIDGFNLALPQGTGVAAYGFALAQTLKEKGCEVSGLYGLRAPLDPQLRNVLFFEALGAEHRTRSPRVGTRAWFREMSAIARQREPREIAIDGSVLAGQFADRLPSFDRLFTVPDMFDQAARNFRRFGRFLTIRLPDPPDVMHWTYPWPIQVAGTANIYTMHDLVPLKLPYTTLDNKRYYRDLIDGCVRRADALATVSDASRRDIEDLFPAARGKVITTHQAVCVPNDVLAEPEARLAATLESMFGLKLDAYFLFVGAIEPKKNVGRLLEAYLSLGSETPLVIAGREGWSADGELVLLRGGAGARGSGMDRVRRLDYLPRGLLMRLIRGAKALVFPSLYEGFGLPVAEAMLLGTPVLASTTEALVEITGGAALLVDPYRPDAIAGALRALDADPELRASLSAAGRVQAARFAPDVYGDRLLALYSRVSSQRTYAASSLTGASVSR